MIAFDHLAAVETAANIPLGFIFNVDRANRLLVLKTEDVSQPGFASVLDRTIEKNWTNGNGAIQHIVQSQMLEHLMRLSANDRAYDDVRAVCFDRLKKLTTRIKGKEFKEDPFYSYIDMRISQFLEDPSEFKSDPTIKAPDGSPIGSCNF